MGSEVRFRVLASLYLLLALLGVGFAYTRRPWDFRGATETVAHVAPAEAVVNGEAITEEELIAALNAEHGTEVLQSLMEQHAIIQEAAREKITLDDPDSLLQLESLNKKTSDPLTYAALERELRAQLLLRKMLLQNATSEQKQAIYDHFKPQLIEYDVYALAVSSPAAAASAETALRQGQSFESVCSRWASNTRYVHLGLLTAPALQAMMGADAVTAVRDLKGTGNYTPPVNTIQGLVIFKVSRALSTYEELKPAVEDMLVAAQRDAFVFQLTRSSRVSYPLAEALSTLRSSVPDAKLPPQENVFAQPSAVPPGHASQVFAPAPELPGEETPVIFAPPPAGIPASQQKNGVFAPVAVPSSAPSTGIFAPLPKPVHKTGVFAPLPSAIKHADGVYAPLPSAVK